MFVDAEERQNLLENDENEIDEQDREIPEVNVKPESEAIGFIQAVKIPGVIPVRWIVFYNCHYDLKSHRAACGHRSRRMFVSLF